MSSFDLTDGKERLSLVRAIYFKQLPQNITWNIKQSTVKIIRPHVDLFLLTKMMTYQPHFFLIFKDRRQSGSSNLWKIIEPLCEKSSWEESTGYKWLV